MMNLGVKYGYSRRIYCLSSYYFYSEYLVKNRMKIQSSNQKVLTDALANVVDADQKLRQIRV